MQEGAEQGARQGHDLRLLKRLEGGQERPAVEGLGQVEARAGAQVAEDVLAPLERDLPGAHQPLAYKEHLGRGVALQGDDLLRLVDAQRGRRRQARVRLGRQAGQEGRVEQGQG